MGTPAAAVPALERCLQDGHEIVSVWTQPDRPAGRGNRVTQSPVKIFARTHGLLVRQPVKIKTQESFELFKSDNADAAVVVAYGRILPNDILRAPHRGCINIHFSLLPLYRGAAPVNWAIIRGEHETGVTTMHVEEQLDTGPILLQRSTGIGDFETATELMSRLSIIGAELLSETLLRLNEIEPLVQDDSKATFAPSLKREDGLIDWALDGFQIERQIRGLQPWPNAFTTFNGSRLIIWKAAAAKLEHEGHSSGEVVRAHGDELCIACGDGTGLQVIEVQPEGKRRMSIRDYLNGVKIAKGTVLG